MWISLAYVGTQYRDTFQKNGFECLVRKIKTFRGLVGKSILLHFRKWGKVCFNFARQALDSLVSQMAGAADLARVESSFILSHSTERWLVFLFLLEHKVSSVTHCVFNHPRTS